MSRGDTAIITGASRGLGRALAAGLARLDWRLVIDARGSDELRRAARELSEFTQVHALVGDVADTAHQQALVAAAGERIDLLVNNASVLGPSPQPELGSYPLGDLERVFQINVCAPLALIQLALPRMAGGCVINVTSDAAVEPYPGWGGYGSSKAALEQLTAVLGAEHPDLRPPAARAKRAGTARFDRRLAPEWALPDARARRGRTVTALAPALTIDAREPPEARGLARDEVRLMVATRASAAIVHTRFRELPNYLRPGDLLVINNSATLPAAVPATRVDGSAIEVRFSTRAPLGPGTDLFVVELRRAGGESPAQTGRAGEQLQLAGGMQLELLVPYAGSGRLWVAQARTGEDLHPYLARQGRPIRYGYVRERWPLSAYQTAYATIPGSAEMPSAGRPLTPELLTRLAAAGILITPVTLHTGVSSPERHEPPYPEQFSVPEPTAKLVNAVRSWGGHVIAVGTTVVRALETVAERDGTVRAEEGWTNLVISAERGPTAVDGIITGWHEPLASHMQLLEAIGGEALIRRCYASARAHGYLWHEFGDSHLILP